MFFDRAVEDVAKVGRKAEFSTCKMFLARCGVFEIVVKSDVLCENIFFGF